MDMELEAGLRDIMTPLGGHDIEAHTPQARPFSRGLLSQSPRHSFHERGAGKDLSIYEVGFYL